MNEENIEEDVTVEQIRKNKMNEYRKKLAEQQKIKENLKIALRQILENEAYERMMNVSFSNEQLYMIAAQQLIAIAQRAGRKLTESEVIYVLNVIKQKTTNEPKITFINK